MWALSLLRRRIQALRADERGMSLPELLVAATIMIALMGAIYGALNAFERSASRTQDANDAQERARATTDRLAWQLRNLVMPTTSTTGPIEQASSYDLVFQTITSSTGAGANATKAGRVRYCYDNSTPADARIWLQTQTWTTASAPAVPSTAICPAPEWGNQRVVADHLVNRYNGQSRPAFATIAFPSSSTDPADVVGLRTDLYLDVDPTRAPVESRLTSAMQLRNSNRRPQAGFHAAQVGTQITLDASPSFDPEGQLLTYAWSVSGGTCTPALGTNSQANCAGLASGSTATFTLTVTDPGGLTNSTSKPVTLK